MTIKLGNVDDKKMLIAPFSPHPLI